MPNRSIGLCGVLLLAILVVVSGCALPVVTERPQSRALAAAQTAATRLGQATVPLTQAHPGNSGVLLLEDPFDAFAARVLLAEAADASLDVQYYIWHNDMTGSMLLDALYRAAERGVRVRLLLDDNGISGLDAILATLDAHPNIEVRLFNPFVIRRPKWMGYLTEPRRLNHRMHNKAFIADNQAAIIGGRNIADEYFGAAPGALFADLDVLAIGPVVQDLSADFDRYWSSAAAWPVSAILPPAVPPQYPAPVPGRCGQDSDAARYVCAVEASGFLQALLSGTLAFTWAPVSMVSDDPAKAVGENTENGLLSRQLEAAIGHPQQSVTLISPYFVPARTGLDMFRELRRRGGRVRVLTNSLAASDVALVHAGYARYRKPLLQAGVQLFELRNLSGETPAGSRLRRSLAGSSASSLHAKTFAVDGRTLFVGSANFDPRSVHINTELGFVIESPELAQKIEAWFDEQVRRVAYELVLDEDGRLQWLEYDDGTVIRHRREPDTGPVKRMLVYLFSWLPVEPLL